MFSGIVAVCRRGREGFACSFNVLCVCGCVDVGGGEGFACGLYVFGFRVVVCRRGKGFRVVALLDLL